MSAPNSLAYIEYNNLNAYACNLQAELNRLHTLQRNCYGNGAMSRTISQRINTAQKELRKTMRRMQTIQLSMYKKSMGYGRQRYSRRRYY